MENTNCKRIESLSSQIRIIGFFESEKRERMWKKIDL